ncbi:SAM-dependent methyltransferase [Candidatus Poribacteria bacterium]|nr:MAG: SAM-dependent methyltransferase [Candidatus Poribacteria bacterium]
MQINLHETRQYLKEFRFEDLFIDELRWDNHTETLNIPIDETEYALTAIAEKRGMAVYECPQRTSEENIPDYATRRKIQKQVAKSTHENFIIYTDAEKTTQIWQWVKRQQGKPDACREHRYETWQSGDSLIQKLQNIAISFEEEEEISLFGVIERVGTAFYAEKVTKKFYDHFKKEHDAFLEFLSGIPDEDMQKWYVSVMLNRLMFIYFIQKKGFLNSDINYLQTKLTETQENGTDLYYKEFLCPLFFEGFAKPENVRTVEMKRLLGKIPYLNGGIFQKHQLETLHGDTIEIPDTAFEKLFAFFEQYQWHLDDRPLKNDNEINPDVLGYIFEKYINQKQMGAYYTKEDITEYISKNTIIPFLFDKAREKCKIAFEGDTSVWKLLQENPDRYIYDAVKKGVDLDLPAEIAIGIDNVSERTEWNERAPDGVDGIALPTEIWREVVARRQRYESVRAKLENGEIDNINDLITYNLNIRQFAQDVIENCEGPELLRAFWKAITEVTVLDPTCGSGAFLFAALNILEPLYEACLDRMQVFVDELVTVSPLTRGAGGLEVSPLTRGAGGLEDAPKKPHALKYNDFRQTLDRIAEHPNRDYFVLKSIIINNLYGVDIMEEAIEICKLRLFLKMVAQIQDVQQIEPLPDIDFNIQAGNTLVGFATYNEVEKAVTERLSSHFDDTMQRIEEKAEDIKVLFDKFREQQTELGGDVTLDAKQNLQNRLKELEDELNEYLAKEYNVEPSKKPDYDNWKNSHKPFHWFIAFYGILQAGGFDVIIGNPPYVEYRKVKEEYTVKGFETESCGNLYAYVMERGTVLNSGRTSWIVPISWVSTIRMEPIRNVVARAHPTLYTNNHADRPGSLFTGVHQKLTIVFCTDGNPATYTTKFCRCYTKEGERENLFKSLSYYQMEWNGGIIRKFSDVLETNILLKISLKTDPLTKYINKRRMSDNIQSLSINHRLMMWVKCFLTYRDSIQYMTYYPNQNYSAKELMAILNSSLFFWFWETKGDCWNLIKGDLSAFRINLDQFTETQRERLQHLGECLELDLEENKEYVGTRQIDYEYYHKKSKHIIDDIDNVLAQHYNLTEEELDFIINYAIKYRMGLGN